MLKFIFRLLLYYQWRRNKPKLNDHSISILDRALVASRLFREANRPDLSLRNCSRFYMPTQMPSLHTMLSELVKAVEDFRTHGKISPATDSGELVSMRVDRWFLNRSIEGFRGIGIYEGYILAGRLIRELNGLIETENQKSYVERRCLKLFNTYILLTELMGHINYELEE